MEKNSIFQVVVLAASVLLILAGVGAFALFGGALGGGSAGAVSIWGTLDGQTIQNTINTLKQNNKALDQVTYVEKDPATYVQDIVNAIASGNPPDLFLLPQEDIAALSDKLQVIPYSTVSQSSFTSSFIDEGQIFLTPQGELALPLTVDPLVMYWNRDLYATAGIASPPQFWSELLADAPRITVADSGGNISRSAAALGLWQNIPNAKALLSTLVMQAGDPMVVAGAQGYVPVFGQNPQNAPENPAESALRFYTDFANPSKSVYSWNRSLPSARDAFSAGDLATYFGFASEYKGLTQANPNLHIAAANIPQVQGQQRALTYGRLLGLAIPRGAHNVPGALAVAQALTADASAGAIAQALGLPPVKRALIQNTPESATQQVFMQSALIAQGWLDPDSGATDHIFQTMIESVLSGALTPADAVSSASQAFARLFPQQGASQ